MNPHIRWSKALRDHGSRIGREGMSQLVIKAVSEFDGSYVGAMVLAGRLKAITQMAGSDDYWSEKVSIGFHRELDRVLAEAERRRAALSEAQP